MFGALNASLTPVYGKEIGRSCGGSVVFSGTYWQKTGTFPSGKPIYTTKYLKEVELATLEGRGRCSKRKPKQCRKSARSQIYNCARELWSQRFNRTVPSSCFRGNKKVFANLRWTGIWLKRQNDIKYKIEWITCCKKRVPYHAGVAIKFYTTGDKGCGDFRVRRKHYQGGHLLQGAYRINCKALRAKGLCN